mgnify:FL=1
MTLGIRERDYEGETGWGRIILIMSTVISIGVCSVKILVFFAYPAPERDGHHK